MAPDKANVEIDGKTMLDRVAAALGQVCRQVVVLGESRAGYENWPDDIDSPGPLAGIATALNRARQDRVLVVAVDNAFVRAETLIQLVAVESELPVVPVDAAGVRQVTCAVYPTAIADQASEEAEGGGSIQSLLDRVALHPVTPDIWSGWGEDGRSWFSVDSPEALAEATDRFGG
jgi:molybdopterin-guanine dinucleotide biosynthesis protein A